MRSLYIVDQGNIWLGNITEVSNFSTGTGTHFNHRQIGFAVHGQQGQRHTYMVIEVARSGMNRATVAQNSSDCFFD